jgi:hypothetical protein
LRGGIQFGAADYGEARTLLGADRILAAFAAREREKSYVIAGAARQICEQRGSFVIGMRGDEENASGDACAIDCFDGVGQTLAVRIFRGTLRARRNRGAEH